MAKKKKMNVKKQMPAFWETLIQASSHQCLNTEGGVVWKLTVYQTLPLFGGSKI